MRPTLLEHLFWSHAGEGEGPHGADGAMRHLDGPGVDEAVDPVL
jgi:hypothetical protein